MNASRRLSAVALLCALFGAWLKADSTVGAAYLLRGVSPQEDALGGGALAAYGSAAAQWENPAALGPSGAQTFSFDQGFTPLGGIAEYAAAAIGFGTDLDQHIGLQAYYLGETDSYRNNLGQISDSFTNAESLLGCSYARELGAWSLGADLKALGESLAGQSARPGLLADLGAVYQANADWLLSAAVRNIGSVPSWPGAVSYRPESFEFAARENLLDGCASPRLYEFLGRDDPNNVPFGVAQFTQGATSNPEFFYGLGGDYIVQSAYPLDLRLGYSNSASNPSFPYGLSAGFGVSWSDLEFDYSFLSLGDLGASNVLAVTWTPSTSHATAGKSGEAAGGSADQAAIDTAAAIPGNAASRATASAASPNAPPSPLPTPTELPWF